MNALYLSTSGDVITELATPLEVEGYGCGVIELTGKVRSGFREDLYLCCDICEESFIDGTKMPILRMLDRYSNGEIKNDINHVIWLKVMRPTINSVRLYIADRYGKIISVEDNEVNCTLLFVPNPKAS